MFTLRTDFIEEKREFIIEKLREMKVILERMANPRATATRNPSSAIVIATTTQASNHATTSHIIALLQCLLPICNAIHPPNPQTLINTDNPPPPQKQQENPKQNPSPNNNNPLSPPVPPQARALQQEPPRHRHHLRQGNIDKTTTTQHIGLSLARLGFSAVANGPRRRPPQPRVHPTQHHRSNAPAGDPVPKSATHELTASFLDHRHYFHQQSLQAADFDRHWRGNNRSSDDDDDEGKENNLENFAKISDSSNPNERYSTSNSSNNNNNQKSKHVSDLGWEEGSAKMYSRVFN